MAATPRHRALVGLIAATLLLAGCGGTTSEGGISGGGKVIGNTVTVYSLTSDPAGANRDFVDAQKLALSDAGGRAGALAVNFSSLDLGADETLQAQAARRAIADPAIIAAIVDANTRHRAAVQRGRAAAGRARRRRAPGVRPERAAVRQAHDRRSSAKAPRRPTSHAASKPPSAASPPRAPSAATARCRAILKAIADAGAGGNDRTRVIDAYFA